MSIALVRERLIDFRSCWVVFNHAVRGRPGGLLQFSKWKLLRSAWHLIHLAFTQCGRTGRDAMLERCGCSVFHLTSSFRTWWYHLILNSLCRHHWSRASILCTFLLVTAQHSEQYRTRKPCYRKENRAMRPVYGCPKNLRSPWLCPRLLFPKLLMGFVVIDRMKVHAKFEVRSFPRSWDNRGYF